MRGPSALMVVSEAAASSIESNRPRRTGIRGLSAAERDVLRGARLRLEHPSLAARIGAACGTPFDSGLELLPRTWRDSIVSTAEDAISAALTVATATLVAVMPGQSPQNALHQGLGAMTGAAGGFFGLPGFLVELPLTTMLMLRSIADVARSEGEDLEDPASRRACVHVFAFGGHPDDKGAGVAHYFRVRNALLGHERSFAVAQAIAARFGAALADKAAAQLLPVAGAVGGALANALLMQHYQDLAAAHFTVRRLERRHGPVRVRTTYESLGGRVRATRSRRGTRRTRAYARAV